MWQGDECSKYLTNSSVKLIFKLALIQEASKYGNCSIEKKIKLGN